MYLCSRLHGQATSVWPGASGMPTECRQGTKSPSSPSASTRRAAHARHDPHAHRDVGRIGDLHADVRDGRADRTHAERARRTCVRPRMQPSNSCSSRAFISRGSTQLLVGPASALWMLQMKVRSSTRATSPGPSGRGSCRGASRCSAGSACRADQLRAQPSILPSEPSHQTMRCGRVSCATSITHWRRRWWRTYSGISGPPHAVRDRGVRQQSTVLRSPRGKS